MIRIAVVGDIGSGKSHVAKKFGYPVFNADIEVSKLYKKSKKCYKKLKKNLPKYISKFPIEKKQLNKAIIEDRKNIKKIIKIVHPEIRIKMNQFMRKNKYKRAIVLDIPLYLENKLNKKNDVLIFVDAKKKEINKRLRKRLNFNYEIYKTLKKFQLPLEKKKKKSTFIIKNNFKKSYTKKNIKKVLRQIL